MKKCKQCGQKDGVHKMSCESRKQFIGSEDIFKQLKDIVKGKNNG